MRRPSVFFLLAYCTGIWWALSDVRPALFMSVVLTLSLLFEINTKKVIVLVLGLAIGLGMTSLKAAQLETENSWLMGIQPFQISGTVYQREVLDQNTCWLKTDRQQWVRLRFNSKQPLPIIEPGSRLLVSGDYAAAEPARNPGGFHEKRWLHANNATGSVFVRSIKIVGLGSRSEAVRHKIGGAFAQSLLQNTAFQQGPMAAGMLLGEDSWIPQTVLQAYMDSGTNHILSVSGAHFGVLLFWIYKLTERKSFDYLTKKIGIWAVLGVFIWLIGADSAAMRAFVMFVVMDVSRMAYKQPDALNCLCIAVSLILLANPMMLWDIGLQLAFAAMYGLLVLRPFSKGFLGPRIKSRSFTSKAVDAVIGSISVSLCLYPILCNQFNTFSWYSILYNVPVAFFSGICLPLSLLVALFFAALPLARVIGIVAGGSLWLMSAVVSTSSLLPKSHALPSLTVVEFSLYLTLLMLPLYFKQVAAGVAHMTRRRWVQRGHLHRLKAFACLVSLVLAFLFTPYLSSIHIPTEALHVSYLDVGQGDGAVIQTPEGQVIVIDAGLEKGRLQVADSLLKLGISEVDWLILSHPHSDHIGGALTVLDKLHVKRLSYFEGNYEPLEVEALNQIKSKALAKSADFLSLSAGETQQLEKDLSLQVLHPHAGFDSESANDESLVLQFQYKNANFLFTGDISTQVEYDIIGKIPRGSVVLKVPHHGSSTSSGEALTALEGVDLAVIQVGKKNRYGHPKDSVLEAYAANQVPVIRNDISGCIRVTTNGEKLWYSLQIQEDQHDIWQSASRNKQ